MGGDGAPGGLNTSFQNEDAFGDRIMSEVNHGTVTEEKDDGDGGETNLEINLGQGNIFKTDLEEDFSPKSAFEANNNDGKILNNSFDNFGDEEEDPQFLAAIENSRNDQ